MTNDLYQLVLMWFAAANKHTAFEAIYQLCYPKIRLYFMRMGLACAADADELAQETMLKFFNALPKLRDPFRWIIS